MLLINFGWIINFRVLSEESYVFKDNRIRMMTGVGLLRWLWTVAVKKEYGDILFIRVHTSGTCHTLKRWGFNYERY